MNANPNFAELARLLNSNSPDKVLLDQLLEDYVWCSDDSDPESDADMEMDIGRDSHSDTDSSDGDEQDTELQLLGR